MINRSHIALTLICFFSSAHGMTERDKCFARFDTLDKIYDDQINADQRMHKLLETTPCEPQERRQIEKNLRASEQKKKELLQAMDSLNEKYHELPHRGKKAKENQ